MSQWDKSTPCIGDGHENNNGKICEAYLLKTCRRQRYGYHLVCDAYV